MTEAVPPVQEVAFTIQIAGAPELTVLDLAAVHGLFADEFPEFQEAPVAPAIIVGPPGQQTHEFTLGPTLPRVWFISSDLGWLVQLQNDRFSLNWRHTDGQSGASLYPGFSAIQSRFFECLERFERWFVHRRGQAPAYDIAELTYVDIVPMQKHSGEIARLSEIFAFYNPTRGAIPIANFSCSWGEPIGEPTLPRGWTVIEAKSGLMTPLGVGALLQTAGRIPVRGTTPSPDWFRESHEHAVAIYQSLLKSPS